MHSGRPAVFCRFSGCNLWSGYEKDRFKAPCKFCDTDFVYCDQSSGGSYANNFVLFQKLCSFWPLREKEFLGDPFVLFTGGEPSLQLDEDLVQLMKDAGFETAVETNGTLDLPCNLDWVCVSPKAYTEVKIKSGNELKLVFPQDGIDPKDFEHWDFEHFFLQPMSSQNYEINLQLAVNYCLESPKWKLSLQTQKYINIP